MNTRSKSHYTITLLLNTLSKRTIGCFSYQEAAEKAVPTIECESLYTYLVLEEVPTGVYQLARTVRWYRAAGGNLGHPFWQPCAPPNWARYVNNFSIG